MSAIGDIPARLAPGPGWPGLSVSVSAYGTGSLIGCMVLSW
jgi:hypothetical protein